MQNLQLPKQSYLVIAHVLFLLFFVSLFFSLRAVSSIGCGLMLIYPFFFYKKGFISWREHTPVLLFIGACVVFFLLQVFALLYTVDIEEGWKNIQLKSGLVVIPIGLYGMCVLARDSLKIIFLYFCIILVVSLIYCTVNMIPLWLETGDSSYIFYHQLVSPLNQHAVYVSIYVFTALVYLINSLRKKDLLVARGGYILLILLLVIFMLMLSSKLVIAFFLLYLFFGGIDYIIKGKRRIIGFSVLATILVSGILILFTNNPVGRRFADLKGDMGLIRTAQNTPGDYFNGLQFRLLQWKLVPEILNENDAWVLGVSPAEGQHLLDKKYISRNMYHGFQGYFTHNSFLEALLDNGIIGLVVMITLIFFMLRMAWFTRRSGFTIILVLIAAYACTESLAETQYGTFILTGLPVLLFMASYRWPRETSALPGMTAGIG
jgi:O-antigen ligase